MNTYAVYLKPRSSMASLPSSDTLFGAVCWGMRLLGLIDDLGGWLEEHKESPPFAFSEPQPFIFRSDGSPLIHFFPRPRFLEVSPLAIYQRFKEQPDQGGKKKLIELSDKAKRINKLAYVSYAVLQAIVQQGWGFIQALDSFGSLRDNEEKYAVFLGKGFLITKAEKQRLAGEVSLEEMGFLQEVLVQHNHIDRVTSTTAEGLLFMRKEVWFQPYVGLWAMLRAEKAEAEKRIIPALRFLADNGLGGNRSVGKGHYDIDVQPLPFELPSIKDGNAIMVLSRYLPSKDEEECLQNAFAYQVKTLHPKREHKYPVTDISRDAMPIYKEMVRMFEPGSVFCTQADKPLWGRLAKVVSEIEDQPAYQSGAALSIRMQLAEVS